MLGKLRLGRRSSNDDKEKEEIEEKAATVRPLLAIVRDIKSQLDISAPSMKAALSQAMHQLELPDSGSAKDKAHRAAEVLGIEVLEGSTQLPPPPNPLAIHVSVISGRDLIAMDSNGFSDPFFFAEVKRSTGTSLRPPRRFKSTPQRRTLNPQWFQSWTWSGIEEAPETLNLVLTIMDHDVMLGVKTAEKMGKVEIPVASLGTEMDAAREIWFPLAKDERMESVSGELLLSAWRDDSVDFRCAICGRHNDKSSRNECRTCGASPQRRPNTRITVGGRRNSDRTRDLWLARRRQGFSVEATEPRPPWASA